MIRRPPRSTRTDTVFPYTTLFRSLPPITQVAAGVASPTPKPDVTRVDTAGAKYPENRTFRFAIPSLRLKSGVRFELANIGRSSEREWRVAFWFGTSKDIRRLT